MKAAIHRTRQSPNISGHERLYAQAEARPPTHLHSAQITRRHFRQKTWKKSRLHTHRHTRGASLSAPSLYCSLTLTEGGRFLLGSFQEQLHSWKNKKALKKRLVHSAPAGWPERGQASRSDGFSNSVETDQTWRGSGHRGRRCELRLSPQRVIFLYLVQKKQSEKETSASLGSLLGHLTHLSVCWWAESLFLKV